MKYSRKWNEQFAKKGERIELKHTREKVKKPRNVRKSVGQ